MSSVIVGAITMAAFVIILNGFAAGMVAIAYFWRDAQGVTKRALIGALGSGLATMAMSSGPMIAASVNGEGPGFTAFILAVFLALGGVISLPGAYILSRKIGDRQKVDPDVFS